MASRLYELNTPKRTHHTPEPRPCCRPSLPPIPSPNPKSYKEEIGFSDFPFLKETSPGVAISQLIFPVIKDSPSCQLPSFFDPHLI